MTIGKEKSIIYQVGSISKAYSDYATMETYKTAESEYYVCKYCGENDIDKFKSRAHLIPEFTGNKDWFCFNECDKCNNKFSVYEYNLKNFGAFKNAHLPIQGKKKFPKYVDCDNNFFIQYQKDGSLLMNVNGDSDCFKIENNRIKIKSKTTPFVPLNVYKCLVKIALSMMELKDFRNFEIIDWLNDSKLKINSKIPLTMLYNPTGKAILKPIAILLKRKNDYNCPEFTFVFWYGFTKFQIYLPFNSMDENLDLTALKFPIVPDFITKEKNNQYGVAHYDMNSLNKISRIEELNFGIS